MLLYDQTVTLTNLYVSSKTSEPTLSSHKTMRHVPQLSEIVQSCFVSGSGQFLAETFTAD